MSAGEFYRQLTRLVESGHPCAVATIVTVSGSVPNDVGAKMLVDSSGVRIAGTVGGGRIEHQVLSAARDAIADRCSRVVQARLTDEQSGGIGMMCGGQVDVFIDVHLPAATLLLVGAGHVNLALSRLAVTLDYRLHVVDDRPEWASAALYPDAEITVAVPEDAMADLGVDEHTYIVIGTRAGDAEALVAAAATAAPYIGVVASRRKAVQLVREVADRVDVDALLPRLRGPVGLDVGGRSPEALALSIMAEIQAVRHGRAGGPMTVTPERLRELLERRSS